MRESRQNLHRQKPSVISELSELLLRVIDNNSNLSQRALAKRIRVSSGYISQVLKGEKIPSDEMLIKISAALDLKDVTVTRILAASQKVRLNKKSKNLSLPTTSLIASRMPMETEIDVRPRSDEQNLKFWSEYFKNHELMIASSALKLDVGVKNLQWFSEIMGTSIENAKEMLATLLQLGIAVVQKTDRGVIIKNVETKPTSFLNISSAIRKKLMKSFIKVVSDSIDIQPDDLPLRGMALTLNPDQLPELKALIDEFTRKALSLSAGPGPKTKIYCVQLSTIDWGITAAARLANIKPSSTSSSLNCN